MVSCGVDFAFVCVYGDTTSRGVCWCLLLFCDFGFGLLGCGFWWYGGFGVAAGVWVGLYLMIFFIGFLFVVLGLA